MTDFDKKHLAIFAGVEILAYLAARLIVMLLDFVPTLPTEMMNSSFVLLKEFVVPVVLIIAALVFLGYYKNNRDGGGTI